MIGMITTNDRIKIYTYSSVIFLRYYRASTMAFPQCYSEVLCQVLIYLGGVTESSMITCLRTMEKVSLMIS